MAYSNQEFRELVNAAPTMTASATISVTGGLFRTEDTEQFGLTLANGDKLTLPIAAVQQHIEMGGAFGQQLVQVKLGVESLPAETATKLQANYSIPAKKPHSDGTGFGEDPIPKDPREITWAHWDNKPSWSDNFASGAKVPSIDFQGNPGAVPFVLAGPHQVNPETLAMMSGYAPFTPIHTVGPSDYGKRPWQDGTYPTPHGWHKDF